MKTKIIVTCFLCFFAASLVSAQNVIKLDPGTNQISGAMGTAQPGDILELSEGIYSETTTLNTIAGDLTIRGAENAEVIVYGPTEVAGDLIHVYGNLWLQNLILVGSDKSVNGIVNYYGGVDADGGELTADKNNIYIDNCMSLVFVINHIFQSAINTDFSDSKWHPIDTLRITNCLFYGADVTNDRAIYIRQRQGRYIEVRNSTIWSLGQDALEVRGAYVGDDYDNPGPGSDLQYVTTIADHLTVFNTYNNCPEQYIGRGGDGIHYEWSNRKQSMTNTIVFRAGRFCFKGKRGEPELTVASYCMGDSANVSGDYSPPTVYYWTMTKGDGTWETNPFFTDHWNGVFSLDPNFSDAIGGAEDGSNMGDLHWDDPSTYWPNKSELEAIIAKAEGAATAVNDQNPAEVEDFTLHQNYPNPFNPGTAISYSLVKPGHTTLTLFNIIGQAVATLVSEYKGTGSYSVVWNGCDDQGIPVPDGVYYYRLRSRSNVQTKKMVLIK